MVEGVGQSPLILAEKLWQPANTERGLHKAGGSEDVQRPDDREGTRGEKTEAVRVFLGIVKSVPRLREWL